MSQPTLFAADVERSATIDPTGRYRYDLTRAWDPDGPTVNFVLLNPSTADGLADDPTVRRCLGYARAWGYGSLVITNLYALRATDPRELWAADDPVGPENDAFILRHARAATLTVCGWGNLGAAGWGAGPARRGRGPAVLEMLRAAGVAPHALTTTATSQPGHPLYLPACLIPRPID